MMLQKALDQVVFIPGDLHSGGFHLMQIVYNLFYVYILQKVQTVLKWKQICGSNVSKHYQQETSLASMSAVEIEHHLLSHYIKGIEECEVELERCMNIIDPQEFAIFIATGYTTWAKEK